MEKGLRERQTVYFCPGSPEIAREMVGVLEAFCHQRPKNTGRRIINFQGSPGIAREMVGGHPWPRNTIHSHPSPEDN